MPEAAKRTESFNLDRKVSEDLSIIVTPNRIIDFAMKNNYKIFEDHLNIWGIRIPKGENFNDLFFIFWKEDTWKSILTYGTTEPSAGYIPTIIKQGGRNPNGISVLVANEQYINCWQLGLHKGKYKALTQRWDYRFTTFRKKKDEEDYYEGPIYTDVQGLNFHTTRIGYLTDKIVGFSEGCQVIFDAKLYFDKIVPLFEKYAKIQNKFSYTIIDKDKLC